MEKFLSVADAARLLGVVPATVRQMEREGRLPAQRTAGGMRLFRREDVDQLVAERAKRTEEMRASQDGKEKKEEEQ